MAYRQDGAEPMTNAKLTTGPNSRPKNASLAQTGEGLPDDTGQPVEIDDEEARRIERNIRQMGRNGRGDPEQKTKDEVQQEVELPLKGSA